MNKNRTGKTFLPLLLLLSAFALPNQILSQAAKNKSSQKSAMALIPGATFEMGTDAAEIPALQETFKIRRAELFRDETPRSRVRIDSFYLDKYEVTNSEFKRFLDRNPAWQKDKISAALHNGKYLQDWNGNDFPKDKANHPVVFVTWHAAVAYCQSLGKRLPTEAEWEFAARGGLAGKQFPWGDAPADRTKANFGESEIGSATAVGSYAANNYGLFDMAGNVWEFLADEWQSYPATNELQINPVAGGDFFLKDSYLQIKTRRVIRGGSYGGVPVNLRVTFRDSHAPENAGDHVGFRCARNAGIGAVLSDAAQSETPEGFWEGAVEREGKRWHVNFDIKRESGNYKALADFIDAGGFEREFAVRQNGETFRLERPQPGGAAIVFEGKIEGGFFKGNWSGFGQTAVFNLKRAAKSKPRVYREEEVSFKNGDVTLSGTLILPTEKNGNFPAVVITHGGSPQNERSYYKSWALYFVRRGIAALIYDKRGSGKSTGETRSARMEDLAGDAVASINFLKTRAEIDSRKIGVIGHSQGGWVAPLAATKSKDAAFVIASAASGVTPHKQSIYHRANVMREAGFSEEAVKIASDLRERLYATGKMLLENNPNAENERRKISSELEKIAKEPWLEAAALPPNLDNDRPTRGGLRLLFFEPAPMWEKVKVPVLLVWGDKDTVVPVAESRAIIENALKKAGNKDVTVKIFPNVNHGVVLINREKTWDFPRVDLNYYAAMVEWTFAKVKK